MTQEDKDLLLKDLCARLPYGVRGLRDYTDKVAALHFIIPNCKRPNDTTGFIELEFNDLDCCPIQAFKPYLRPMSSMTEEEKKDILQSLNIHGDIDNEGNLLLGVERNIITLKVCKKYLGELNKRMFDVCHMIEKGLALEAPEGMYKTE